MTKCQLPADHVFFDPNTGELNIGDKTRDALKSFRVSDCVTLIADVIDTPRVGNGGKYVIRLRLDTIEMKQPHFVVGDRARWHENGAWTAGEILALDHSDPNQLWAWVKEDGKWPRRSLSVRDLKR